LKGKDSNVPKVEKGVNNDSKNLTNKVDKHVDKIIDKFHNELAIWRQFFFISIIVFIVGREIIFQRNFDRRRQFISEQFIMVG